jgi:RNA polymerase sigma-70 factor (ECF subfamily)
VSDRLLSQARAGDQDAFRELVGPYLRELQAHCYRILGAVQDAEDIVQETLLGAWRGLAGFEERSPVRAWLYWIATNRCLNALRDAGRRPPPQPPQRVFDPPEPTSRGDPAWLEPYPDVLLEEIADSSPGPEARYEARETIELAFITALQHLPPRQRAVLLLRDVLGFPTAETAVMLEATEDSVKGALKRARATLEQGLPVLGQQRPPAPRSPQERAVVQRFADTYQADDIDGLVALLTGDAWFTMPPVPLQYQGPAAIASFLRHQAASRGPGRVRLVPTRANTQPAFGIYLHDEHAPVAHAATLLVLTLHGEKISALTCFLDTSVLPHFGLPRTLPD